MNLTSLILLTICLGVAWSQGPLPSQCTFYILQGSSSPYPSSAAAAPYQTFCSVKEKVSQCIEDNKISMIQGSSPIDWALGITYVKSVFDKAAYNVCNTLPSVASDLECLKANPNTPCESILPDNAQFILQQLQQYRAGTVTEVQAKEAVCSIMTSSSDCWRSQLSGCSQAAVDFMVDYYGMYSANCISALPPGLGDSAFITCALGAFSEVFQDLSQLEFSNVNVTIEFILNFTLSKVDGVCEKAIEFSTCLDGKIKNTTNEIDELILQFVNVSQIKDTITSACDIFKDIKDSTECLTDLGVQIPFCTVVYFNSNSGEQISTVTTETPVTSSSNASYCPSIKGMVDCMSIPLSKCNDGLTTKISNFMDMVLEDHCKDLSDIGSSYVNLNPYSSVFVKCGVSLLPYGISGSAEMNMNLSDIGNKFFDTLCRNSGWYLSCVEERLPMSKNYIDTFLREVIDFSEDINRKQILADVCTNSLQDIQQNIQCIVTTFAPEQSSDYPYCLENEKEVWRLFDNKAEIAVMNGNTARSTFCKPIENAMSCAKTRYGSCSSKLESLFDEFPKSFLRTDCGGLRQSLTTPSGEYNTGQGSTIRVNTERLYSSASSYRRGTFILVLSFIFSLLLL